MPQTATRQQSAHAPLHQLMADIGGTNARFSILTPDGQIEDVKVYQVRETATLAKALRSYISDVVGNRTLGGMALAVAGPVRGDRVKLTNSDWVCDRDEVAELINAPRERVFIANDFEAIALAIGNMPINKLQVVQKGDPDPHGNRVVMGPGTGLGVCGLDCLPDGTTIARPTEAGHIPYAPANAREADLVDILSQILGTMVTAEHIISGPGLVNLYKAVSTRAGGKIDDTMTPARVVEAALSGDSICKMVVDDFAAMFGSYASIIGLTRNATGGLYLCGGVLGKLDGLFNPKRFTKRMNTNPVMSHLLMQMPVYIVTEDIPAFAGLKCLLR
ncbi:MAG: ROK family protein [Alphaproteobacteria bacterium]|nr:ROK family protein [Alphaproteobacteria bacterium]MBV8548284.1 ROK family protein [Alphaproteobacteria bacterium]